MPQNPAPPNVSPNAPPREFHPVTDLFPLLQGSDFADLVANIKAHGLREPILLDRDGRILDGRNRYRACLEARVEPRFVDWPWEGPVEELILSLNLHRRHFNESQRAMVAARLAKLLETEALKRKGRRSDLAADLQPGDRRRSASEAAAKVNISPRLVYYAIKILQAGIDDLIDAVDSGVLAVTPAAVLAALPRRDQALAFAHGPRHAADDARRLRPPNGIAFTPQSSLGNFGVLPVENSSHPGRPAVPGISFLWLASAHLETAICALKARGFHYKPCPLRAQMEKGGKCG